MSSTEQPLAGPSDAPEASRIRKRRQRACDICRHKKIRCDGYQMPGRMCSPCKAQHNPCTYRDDPKDNQIVLELQEKLRKMELMLSELSPTTSRQHEPDAGIQLMHSNGLFPSSGYRSAEPGSSPDGPDDEDKDTGSSSDENDRRDWPEIIDTHMQDLASSFARFYGDTKLPKSSPQPNKNPITCGPGSLHLKLNFKRPEFWDANWWETSMTKLPGPDFVFPPDDLFPSLVDLYFDFFNVFTPILHRSTFMRSVFEGLHLRDRSFGATVLLVCALGARQSTDPRVIYAGTNTRYSAGFEWYSQVELVDKVSLTKPVTLYELQIYSLGLYFTHLCGAPILCWALVALGIRRAQDLGIHRRRPRRNSIDDELWRRAFWFLVIVDRYMSSALGRPCAIQDEDFDLELPADCDDEYWENEDPAQWFKQPRGVPSRAAFFICHIQLQSIAGIAMQTLYSIKKPKSITRLLGPRWELNVVSELDSDLNKWTDSIPDHLRWDPEREDLVFFNQSAVLHATYHYVQILIHRPFISPAKKMDSLAFPSLVICTNAARAGTQILNAHRLRSSILLPLIHMPIFTSAIVLLLNIWGSKRSNQPGPDPARDMAHVRACMYHLQADEGRWQVAGRLNDILQELARVVEHAPTHPTKTSVTTRGPSHGGTAPLTSFSLQACCGYHQPSFNAPLTLLGDYQQTQDTHPSMNFEVAAQANVPFAQNLQPGQPEEMGNRFGQMKEMPNMDLEQYFAQAASGGPPPSAEQQPANELDFDWTAMQDLEMPLPADTMAMWDNAPANFGLGDWDMYLTNVMMHE